MNAAKRRRLQESNTTLSRPFRSPMRVEMKQTSEPNSVDTSYQPTSTHSTISTHQKLVTSSSVKRTTPKPTVKSPPFTSSTHCPNSNLPTRLPKDATYLALQKQRSALRLQVIQLRSQLDTAQQAVQIMSDRDFNGGSLDDLIEKWTMVARNAADELFHGAKERVDRMGGIAAWRRRVDEQHQHQHQRTDGNLWDGVSEGEYGVDEGESKTESEENDEALLVEDELDQDVVEEQDNEGFTMEMMLRQLNVDPLLIGFDKASQRWM